MNSNLLTVNNETSDASEPVIPVGSALFLIQQNYRDDSPDPEEFSELSAFGHDSNMGEVRKANPKGQPEMEYERSQNQEHAEKAETCETMEAEVAPAMAHSSEDPFGFEEDKKLMTETKLEGQEFSESAEERFEKDDAEEKITPNEDDEKTFKEQPVAPIETVHESYSVIEEKPTVDQDNTLSESSATDKLFEEETVKSGPLLPNEGGDTIVAGSTKSFENETDEKPTLVQHTSSIGSSVETSSGDSETSDDDHKPWTPENDQQNRERLFSDSPNKECSTNSPGGKHEDEPIPMGTDERDATNIVETASLSALSPSSLGTSRDQTPETKEENDEKTLENEPTEKSPRRRKVTEKKKIDRKRKVNNTKPPKSGKKPRRSRKYDSSDDEDGYVRKRLNIPMLKKIFCEKASKWYFVQKLIHARDTLVKSKSNKYSKAKMEKVQKYIDKYMETQDSHYMRATITLDTLFPDQNNYRYCKTYMQNRTVRVIPKPKRRNGRKAAIPANPPRLFMTGTMHIPLDCKSAVVYEAADQIMKGLGNAVYKEEPVFVPEPSGALLLAEKEMYKDELEGLRGFHRNRLPCPTLYVTTKEEVFSPSFERILNSATIVNISGIGKALGINSELFTLEEITKRFPDLGTDILNQIPQTADDNYTFKGIREWECPQLRTTIVLKDFTTYMKAEEDSAFEAFDTIANCTVKEQEPNYQLLKEKWIKAQQIDSSLDKNMPWIKFGTNIDLNTDPYKDQMKELKKLPTFLHFIRRGNLLNYTGVDVLGINTVQLYSKPIGSRTPAHMENSLMASINWNRGPGTCVWFAVPYEYWGKMEAVIQEHNHKYNDQDFWPDEMELLENGIPVIKFEQKADEMVYVNTGCFHWVQSNGFCVNVSWNVGQPNFNQLAAAMITHDHNYIGDHEARIPLISLVWNAAREKLFLDDEEMFKAMRSVMIRSLAHSRWYFELIKKHNYNSLDASDWDESLRKGYRCNYCNCELFNVIRWWTTDEPDAIHYTFCSSCTVQPDFMKKRYLKYTYFFKLETLEKIFDAYTRPAPIL